MMKMIHLVKKRLVILSIQLYVTNFCAKTMNSIAKATNSIVKVTNSIAKATNSIAKHEKTSTTIIIICDQLSETLLVPVLEIHVFTIEGKYAYYKNYFTHVLITLINSKTIMELYQLIYHQISFFMKSKNIFCFIFMPYRKYKLWVLVYIGVKI